MLIPAVTRAAKRVAAVYRGIATPLAELAAQVGFVGLGTLRLRIGQLFDKARAEMADVLRDVGVLGYKTAADSILVAIPSEWLPVFAGLAAAKARSQVSEATLPQPGTAPWDVGYEWEPVVQGAITGEEARSLIKSLLFPPPTEEQVKDWLRTAIPGGLSWDQRLRRWEEPVRQAMFNELVAGLVAGENIDQLRARLEPLADGIAYKAQRIARTEGCRVAERAGRTAFAGMGQLLQGMQIVAVMDEWTRPHHAARNGKIYWRKPDGTYRDDMGQPLPDLPDEPNCRCMTIPVLDVPPAWRDSPAWRTAFETATGKLIPDPASYEDWWRWADERVRMEAVGIRRYQVLRDKLGRPPDWVDFLGPDGRLLPVDVLRKESPQEHERRRFQIELAITQRRALYQTVASTGSPLAVQPEHPASLLFRGAEAVEREIQRLAAEYAKLLEPPEHERLRRAEIEATAARRILRPETIREEIVRRADWWDNTRKMPKPWPKVEWPQYYRQQLADRLDKIYEQARHRNIESMRELLKLPKRYRARLEWKQEVPEAIREQANEALEFIGSITNKRKIEATRVGIEERQALLEGGACYDILKVAVCYRGNVPTARIVHELGHHLQYSVPKLNQETVEWRDRVTKDGKLKAGYGLSSEGIVWYYRERTDGKTWLDTYMGRVYLREPPTDPEQPLKEERYVHEVVSVGVQYLYTYPHVLARREPELFDLLLRLLRSGHA